MDGTPRRSSLAIAGVDDFVFGKAPRPLRCGHGVEIGKGTVIPEINFTLKPVDIHAETMPEIRAEYTEMVTGICTRAVALKVPALLVEFETLPAMTVHPEWALEITRLIADILNDFFETQGLRTAFRLTPNDTRDHVRPPRMRSGEYWEGMLEVFEKAGEAGADLVAIESTGGKEVCDDALMNADLRTVVFALGVLGTRDMEFLWKSIVRIGTSSGVVPAGDTACGFANTAMVLAEERFIPRVFAAVVRVAAVPRSLVAYEVGAKGPSKDCAYEGPYMKAIAGVPISMEGRTAACAHLSSVGNIAQAVCDCWSNESVQNLRLLSANAPTVSLEQLAYDCRLLNVAASRSEEDALRLRDWLVESDAATDPQAYVLRPDVVLRISEKIAAVDGGYPRTRVAVTAAVEEIKAGVEEGTLNLPQREAKWLDRLSAEVETLPESEEDFLEEMKASPIGEKFIPEEYGL